jgi:hypothetical protein
LHKDSDLARNICSFSIKIIVQIRDAPYTDFAGYPAKPKAGYRISGRISGKGQIPDIRPDTWFDNIFLVKYQINLLKQL